MQHDSNTAASLYAKLESDRQPYLDDAREGAAFSSPTWMPKEGDNPYSDRSQGFQSLASRGTMTLASKMMGSLFPTAQPNFQLKLDAFALQTLQAGQSPESFSGQIEQINATLARTEQAVNDEIASRGFRHMLHEGVIQLIVSGNVLINVPEKGNMKVFRMDTYVVKRDHQGAETDIIIKEQILPMHLPEEITQSMNVDSDSKINFNDAVDIYTRMSRSRSEDGEGFAWTLVQEAMGKEIESTRIDFGVDEPLPYLALRYSVQTGRDWSDSYLSFLMGDLKTFEAYNQYLNEGAAMASKVIYLVRESANGTTSEDLASAPNGAFVPGHADDVSILGMAGKVSDLGFVSGASSIIEKRLSQAFLLNSSLTRDAERVTATEFSAMAEELETVLAGSYSLLGLTFQLPLVNIIMASMVKQGRLHDFNKPPLKGLVLPTVTTGLNALGRGSEVARLDAFVSGAVSLLGPQEAFMFIDPSIYLNRRLTALGLLNDGMIKSDSTIQQETQLRAQAEALRTIGPDVAKARLQEEGNTEAQPEQQ